MRPAAAGPGLQLSDLGCAAASIPSSTCTPLGELPGPEDFDGSISIQAVAHWREGEVDAGSTVWPFEGQLVLGQVFDPGLQVCAMPE